MEALKFTVSGATAHFKMPQTNSINLTYTHIHKVALLGLLGNLIWLGGWQSRAKNEMPEFYVKLKDFKISIIPEKNIFHKRTKEYNNSTGFANKDANGAGVGLMVREQYLVNPSWDIYIMSNDTKEFELIQEFILDQKSYGTLYLGKTHHPADIGDAKIIEIKKAKTIDKIDSLFDVYKVNIINAKKMFMQFLPIGLDEKMNYTYKELGVSDGEVTECEDEYYSCENKILYFF